MENNNPTKMNHRDLKRAINDTYGKILEDWKSFGLFPSKDTLFKGGVSPYAVSFIVENYELDEVEVLSLRNTIENLDLNEQASASLQDVVKENNLSFILDKSPLSPSQVVKSFLNASNPVVKDEYLNWSFLKELFIENPNLLDPMENTINGLRDVNDFVSKILEKIDFNEVPSSDPLLPKLYSLINDENSSLLNALNNKSLLKSMCFALSGEDINVSMYAVSKYDIDDAFTAKKLLTSVYHKEINHHLYVSGQANPPFNDTVWAEMQKDAEYKQSMVSRLEKSRVDFKKEQELYGNTGLFYMNGISSDIFWKKIEEHLSFEEINKITEGNALKYIPLSDVPKNKKKIQKIIIDNIKHKVEKNIANSAISLVSLSYILDVVPAGAEKIIFDKDFIKELGDIDALYNKDRKKENRNWNSKDFSLGTADNPEKILTLKSLEKFLDIIAAIPKDRESLHYLNNNLFLTGLFYIEQTIKVLEKGKKIPSSPEEYQEKSEKYMPFVVRLFKENSKLLNIEKMFNNEYMEEGERFFNNILYQFTVGTDTSNLFDELKNNLVDEIVNEKDHISLDEAFFYNMFNFNQKKILSKMTREDSLILKSLYSQESDGFSKYAPYSENSVNTITSLDNKDAVCQLIYSKDYRANVLASGLELPVVAIDKLLEGLYYLDVEDDAEDFKEIEDFLITYLNKNKDFDSVKTFSFPLGFEASLPRLKKIFDENFSSENFINEVIKTKNYSLLSDLDGRFSKGYVFEILEFVGKSDDKSLKDAVFNQNITVGRLIEAGFDNDYLATKIFTNQNKIKELVNANLNLGLREKIVEKLNGLNSENNFREFVGALSQDSEKIDFAISFIKENVKHLLVNHDMTYIYNNSTFNKHITTKDIVEASQELSKLAKENPKYLNLPGIKVDHSTFLAPDQNWKDEIKNLTDFEKLVLLKYGSFAAKSIEKYDDLNDKSAIGKMLTSEKCDFPTDFCINHLNTLMPELYQPEFVKKNKSMIKSVYLSVKASIKDNVMSYNLGDSKSYNNDNPDFDISFKSSKEWNNLIKESFLDNSVLYNDHITLYLHTGLQDDILKKFSLDNEDGIERFFLMVKEGHCTVTFKSREFNFFSNDVFETIKLADDDMQIKFLKLYDAMTLGIRENSENKLPKLLSENENIISIVNTLKLKHKINKVISIKASNNDDYNQDFKM